MIWGSDYERGRRHLDDAKLATGCEICGVQDLEVLDFHHLYDKSFNLSGAACRKPLSRLDDEIRKCVILCANDHRRVHAGIYDITEDNDEHDETGKPCYFAFGYRIYRTRSAG